MEDISMNEDIANDNGPEENTAQEIPTTDKDYGLLYSRPDESYVILEYAGHPYHVPKEGGWLDGTEEVQWQDVHNYALTHPDRILPEPQPEPEPAGPRTLEGAYKAKVTEINDTFESAVKSLLGDEPPHAVSTYATQQAEAEAWTANPDTYTPLLDALANARGIEKEELVRRVLVKAQMYSIASGVLLGQQQALMDQVQAIMEQQASDEEKITLLHDVLVYIIPPKM